MANDEPRDSSMPDPEIHEEIARRTLQISDFKEELWDLRDRVDETDQRYDTLVQGLTTKAHEISMHKSKANQLEDQVALLETSCEVQSRNLRRASIAATAELQELQEKLQRIEEESAATLARAGAEKQRTALLHAEGSSLKAKIEASRRDLARENDELAQEEAAQEAMQARAEKRFEQEEAERKDVAAKQLAAVQELAATTRSQVLRLQQELTMEKATSTGLKESMGQERDRQQLADEEYEALEQYLEHLDLQEEAQKVEDELDKTRQHCQRVSMQSATLQSEIQFKRQGLQGALEETRRMLQDHLASTDSANAASDAGLQELKQALSEAKSQADERQAEVALLEQECSSLQAEVDKVEKDLQAASQPESDDQQRKHSELTLELRAAEQSLRDTSRRGDEKAVEAVRAEAQVTETEKLMKQKEALLRKKLVELWSWLRQLK